MEIRDPDLICNFVRADSPEAADGFGFEQNGIYEYLVPMQDNEANLYIRRQIQEGQSIFIESEYVLVFNVKNNRAGIIRADRMVEPVDFVVTTKGKSNE